MSAVLALFHRHSAPIDARLAERMLSACPERTVNGQRFWSDGPVALAHQHFWVTPEETGEQQPIHDPHKRFTLSADLRLDNRRDLLATLGFTTAEEQSISDAQLLMHCWLRWGEECVSHLLGDYAFVIWDSAEQRLFAARDALGARGLAYYADDRMVVIASEILHILAHPDVPRRRNDRKVADYLASQWDNHEESFYEGIFYCPPGHCLTVTTTAIRKRRYWDLDPDLRIRYKDDAAYAEHFLALFTDAVHCRLRTNGPIGISLSGGLDSTAVAAIASKFLTDQPAPQRLLSFSNVFDELTSCDERQYIAPVIQQLNLAATLLPGDGCWTLRDPDQWPVAADFVHFDAFYRLPEAIAMAVQANGCRTLLTGHFGDSLFDGWVFWALDTIRGGDWSRLVSILTNSRDSVRWRRDLLDHGLRQLIPIGIRKRLRHWRPQHTAPRHPGFAPQLAAATNAQAASAPDDSWRRFSAPGQWPRYRGLTEAATPQGLFSTRRIYASRGIETAHPMHDRRLVEFVAAAPADQLGRPGRSRGMLRNAMASLLPEQIRERTDKTNFAPLMWRGLSERERSTVAALLHNPRIVQEGMISPVWLQRELHSTQWQDGGYHLWLCICLELWLQKYW